MCFIRSYQKNETKMAEKIANANEKIEKYLGRKAF